MHSSGADPGRWIGWLATHLDNANNVQITKYVLNHDFSVELICVYVATRIQEYVYQCAYINETVSSIATWQYFQN